jgi:tRNA dimethylallyltransferase
MILALVGPTASGKTEAGIALAERLDREIASVDSMLVYRGMDVGTAKPTAVDRDRVPHHLLDLAAPSERFTVARFQAAAHELLARVPDPLLVGGSGLYLRAVVDDLDFPPEDHAVRQALETEAATVGIARLFERLADLDPVSAGKIGPGNVRRVVRALEVPAITGSRFSTFAHAWERYDPQRMRAAGIRVDRPILAIRVERRVHAMLDAGWLDEVRGLIDGGFGDWLTSTQAIGYSELARHLDGRLSLEEAVELTVKRTKELARRQMAWFRRDPRIRWFDVGESGAIEAVDRVAAYLEGADA